MDVTAKALVKRHTQERVPPTSKTKFLRAKMREQGKIEGWWDDRFACKQQRIALEQKIRRERARLSGRLLRDTAISGEQRKEQLSKFDADHLASLDAARESEKQERCLLNKRFTECKKLFLGDKTQYFTLKRRSATLARKHQEDRAALFEHLLKDRTMSAEELKEQMAKFDADHAASLAELLILQEEELHRLDKHFRDEKEQFFGPQCPADSTMSFRKLRLKRLQEARPLPAASSKLTIVCLGDAIFSTTMRGHASVGLVSTVAALSRMRGVMVVLVDEYRTSKLCFQCGAEMEQAFPNDPLQSRKFRCSSCKSNRALHASARSEGSATVPTINRDRNAAANILLLGAREIIWNKRPTPWQRSSTESPSMAEEGADKYRS